MFNFQSGGSAMSMRGNPNSVEIGEFVSVVTVFDSDKGTVIPRVIRWKGRVHKISELGYHHTFRQGRVLQHVFSVANQSMAFRLRHDTETLEWVLEEVSEES